MDANESLAIHCTSFITTTNIIIINIIIIAGALNKETEDFQNFL